jgi:HPt (histidine-containing phosphotransfer) domain-containing protein
MNSQPDAALPVNLSQLRDLTDGNEELEQSLFELFYTSSEENLTYLEANCTDAEDVDWKRNAHSLKGAAKNIGAEKLGEICAKAQEMYVAPAPVKRAIIGQIKIEYAKVKEFLQNVNKK